MPVRHQLIYYYVLLLIGLCSWLYSAWISLLILPYVFYLVKRLNKRHILFMFIFCIMFSLTMQVNKPIECDHVGGIIELIDEDKIIIKLEQGKFLLYGKDKRFSEGDYIYVEIKQYELTEPNNDHAFHYPNYLASKGIVGYGRITKVIDYDYHFSFFALLKERFNQDTIIDSFAKVFILGIQDETIDDVYQSIQSLSLVHLFALSGMHIHFLQKWLKSILKFIISPKYLSWVVYFIIGFYIIILPFNISFTRAYLVMVLYQLLNKWLNQLDILAIVGMLMLWINPMMLFSYSYIFSYFIYFIVLITKGLKYQSFMIYLSSIPIVLLMQYELNLFTFLFGLVVTPLIGVLYMCLLFYLCIGNLIAPMITLLIDLLLMVIKFSEYISVMIPFSKPTVLFILLFYYYYFWFILKRSSRKKGFRELLCCSVVLFVFFVYSKYSFYTEVVMINVGQGDCYLIRQAFNKGDILIDTGGWIDGDVASSVVVPYLKSIGVHSLDYVYISHDDFDHSGGYESLSNQIIINNTIDHSVVHDYVIGAVEIHILDLKRTSDDLNDNSLVMDVSIDGIHYLFTGDIGIEKEQQIITTYPDLIVDVLKVGHHGSNTSSSTTFINHTQPKVALISCGLNNQYGHPHQSVLDTLMSYGVKIYRSDLDGMVKLRHYGKNVVIYQ